MSDAPTAAFLLQRDLRRMGAVIRGHDGGNVGGDQLQIGADENVVDLTVGIGGREA